MHTSTLKMRYMYYPCSTERRNSRHKLTFQKQQSQDFKPGSQTAGIHIPNHCQGVIFPSSSLPATYPPASHHTLSYCSSLCATYFIGLVYLKHSYPPPPRGMSPFQISYTSPEGQLEIF